MLEQAGVAAEVQRPSGVAVDPGCDGLPPLTVAVDVAVFEFDARAPGGLGGEADFDLAGSGQVGFQLPGRPDVPGEDDAVRRLEGDDPRPLA